MKYILAIALALTSFITNAQLKKNKIIFNLYLGPKQGTTFFYTDDYSIENRLTFKNTSERDTVISKEVAAENVVMFRYSVMYPDRHRNYFYKFFGKPGEILNIMFDDYDLKGLDDNPYSFVSNYLQIDSSLPNMPTGTPTEKRLKNEHTFERNRKIIDSLAINKAISGTTSDLWKAIAYNSYIFSLSVMNYKDATNFNKYKQQLEAYLSEGSHVNDDAVTAVFYQLLFLSQESKKDIYSKLVAVSHFNASKKYKCGIAFLIMKKFPEKNSALYNKAYTFFNDNFSDPTFRTQPYFGEILPESPFDKSLVKILSVSGKSETLKDLFIQNKGKVIIIDLWATWCIPCVKEIPFFETVRKKLSSKNIAFISLSLDKDAKNKDWLAMSKRLRITGIQARVFEKSNKTISRYYYIESIPRYLVFNKEGVLVNDNFIRPSDPSFSDKLLNYLN